MADYTVSQLRKIKAGKCLTPFCPKKAKNTLYCYACERRRWAAKHPEKYVFANLRGNARRRKKEFSLTLAEFISFISENDFMKLRGRTKFSLCIDRKRNWEGYHKDNIQAITVQSNSFKRNYVDYFRNEDGEEIAVTEDTFDGNFELPVTQEPPF